MEAGLHVNDEAARRRAALASVGIDPDTFFEAERAAERMPAPTRPGLNPLPPDTPTFPTGEREHRLPEACRPLLDHEYAILHDLIPPPAPGAALTNRTFLNAMVALVVGGHGWKDVHTFARGAREKFRRERERPDLWAAVEARARLLLSDPVRAHIERVCQFMRGDYSVRAKRPDGSRRRVSKFGKGSYPTPMEPWTPKHEPPPTVVARAPSRRRRSALVR